MEGVKWSRYDGLNQTLKGFRRGEMTVITGKSLSYSRSLYCLSMEYLEIELIEYRRGILFLFNLHFDIKSYDMVFYL